MDLRKVLVAATRHRVILGLGVVVGLALAFMSLYDIGGGADSAGISRRNSTSYQAEAVIVIDTPSFGIGRVELDTPSDRAYDVAPVYGYLAASDAVMELVGQQVGRPLNAEVTAEQVERAPVVKVLVTGTDAQRVTEVADATVESFIAYLRKMQETNNVPESQRMVVRYVNAPKISAQSSRTLEMAILAFMLPVAGSVGLALGVENLRATRLPSVPEGAGRGGEEWRPVPATHEVPVRPREAPTSGLD